MGYFWIVSSVLTKEEYKERLEALKGDRSELSREVWHADDVDDDRMIGIGGDSRSCELGTFYDNFVGKTPAEIVVWTRKAVKWYQEKYDYCHPSQDELEMLSGDWKHPKTKIYGEYWFLTNALTKTERFIVDCAIKGVDSNKYFGYAVW